MPRFVGGAFDAFRLNTVDVDKTQVAIARVSRDNLTVQLRLLSNKEKDFPPIAGRFIQYGSFNRKTKIRPLNDIDMMMLLRQGEAKAVPTTNPHIFNLKVLNAQSPLKTYMNIDGFVDSSQILFALKQHLGNVPQYSKAEVNKRMQAVVLNLKSYEWSFDIVPAVQISIPSLFSQTVNYFMIPDGKGRWIKTNPFSDQALTTTVNQGHSNRILPVIRLLKAWNRRPGKPVLSSFHLEVMALRIFNSCPQLMSTQLYLQYFFRQAQQFMSKPCPSPSSMGPPLDAYLVSDERTRFTLALTTAAGYAVLAVNQEKAGNQAKAIEYWRQIFGKDFPEYG